MAFENNVFVNCPFDAEYKPLLDPLLFTIRYLGFQPRIALERSESGESRIAKIIELIEESKFAIHDLSRLKAKRKGEISRLNMPFELAWTGGAGNLAAAGCRRKRSLSSRRRDSPINRRYRTLRARTLLHTATSLKRSCRLSETGWPTSVDLQRLGKAKSGVRSMTVWGNSKTTSATVASIPATSRIFPCRNYWRTLESG